MKFGDKLIALRKKNGLSQEELAAKLNVSRQSVSKWESNNTYPETDKIVQICNIFDCRMDDLINDKITDLSQCERKNKTNLNIIFDSLLEFITKSINMFSSMKFTSGLRCLFEIGVLVLILLACGAIFIEGGSSVIMRLFSFLPGRVFELSYNVIVGILELLAIGFSLIILTHVFKVRYLDYYDKIVATSGSDDAKKEEKIEINNEKNVEFKLNQKPKIIIRDKHEAFAFLSFISKIIIWFCKAFVAIFAGCFSLLLIGLVFALFLSITVSKYSILFIGVDLGLVAAIVVNIMLLILMIYFIINKKVNLKAMCYTFLASLLVVGVGAGLAFTGFKDFTFKDSMDDITVLEEDSIDLDFGDDTSAVLVNHFYPHGYEIVIDNSISDNTIRVVGKVDHSFSQQLTYHKERLYGVDVYNFYTYSDPDFKQIYDLVVKDLKRHIFRDYDFAYSDISVRCNSNVANKLIENMKKIYVFDMEETESGYLIEDISNRVEMDYYGCDVDYNALTGEYSYATDSCICDKRIKTVNGDEITYFDCSYIDEE